jgi:hypothetical protein
VSIADDSAADFFAKDQLYWSKGLNAPEKPEYNGNSIGDIVKAGDAQRQKVVQLVTEKVRNAMGSEWVPTALRIAKVESGFNCGAVGPRTRVGRGRGVYQLMPGSSAALGYSYGRLNECSYGIDAGVAHMQKCLESAGGHMTPNQMAACHVSGWAGWNKKLKRRKERYRRDYIRMAMKAKL